MMEIRRIDDIEKESAASPLFTSVNVSRQPLAPLSEDFNCSIVNFGEGVKNKFHVHESDQILIVTQGKGIIATETGESEITEGHVVFAPANEKHWHGAIEGSTFSHITITRKGAQTTQLED
ncbi:MAG: cupin domain-containing protein [SAR202 cluster bacterium]|nr:cupin domain-containing protein [SAR202 cluster bacterium]|tara:strand:+ start:3039 stop:3401 length:363 start_codon:yes stop_codon:yes gene_type:complete